MFTERYSLNIQTRERFICVHLPKLFFLPTYIQILKFISLLRFIKDICSTIFQEEVTFFAIFALYIILLAIFKQQNKMK